METDFTFEHLNKSRVQIKSDNHDLLEELKLAFSYQKRVFGNYAVSYNIDGTGIYSCISPAFSIKKGLTLEIVKWIKANGYTVHVDDEVKEMILPKCSKINDKALIQPNAEFKYRDYQERAINQVLKYGRGVLSSPTSSGKSLILYGICSNIKEFSERTLIIVPRIQLVSQFYKEWTIEYGFKGIAMYSTKNPKLDPNAKVVITNYQFLVSKSKDKTDKVKRKDMELISKGKFKAVIVDECHTIGESGSWLGNFLSKLDCPYAIGCTGTVPDEKSKRWNIIGTLGPVIFTEHIKTLQDRNQIAKIKIKSIQFEHSIRTASEIPWRRSGNIVLDKHSNDVLDSTQMYRAEYQYIESHNFCNNYILNFAENLEGNTVILVDHIDHAQYLFDNCKLENKFLITGATKLDDRLTLSKLVDLQDGKKYIIIAVASCFGTGVSIKNLNNLILCSHGKALTKIIQNLGRILRKVKPDGEEEFGNLYDFSHNQMFSLKHFHSRCNLYKRFYQINAEIGLTKIMVPVGKQNEMRENVLSSICS